VKIDLELSSISLFEPVYSLLGLRLFLRRYIQYSPNFSLFLHRVFSLLSVALQAHCEPTLEGGVVAPQNQFNVKSSWEKRTELKSLHTDVISS